MKKILNQIFSIILVINVILSSLLFANAQTYNVITQSEFIKAINSGATTVNITNDFNVTEQIVIKKSVTINAGNHIITFTGQGGEYLVLSGGVDVIINGGNWHASGGADLIYGNRNNNTAVGDAFSGSVIITGGANIIANVPVNFGVGTSGIFTLDGANLTATSGNAIKNQSAVNLKLLSGSITTEAKKYCIYNDYNSSSSIVVGKPDGTGPIIKATHPSNTQALIYFDSKVTTGMHYIHGGEFIHNGNGSVIDMNKVSEVNIEGGIFESDSSSYPLFNIIASSNVKIMGGSFTATSNNLLKIGTGALVLLKGGTFNEGSQDAFSNLGTLRISGGTYNFDPNSYVVTNYASTPSDGGWIVETSLTSATSVFTFSELKTAISNKKTHIKIADDFSLDSNLTIDCDTVIDGTGYSLTASSKQQLIFSGNSNITLKNVEIEGNGDILKVTGNTDLTISGGVYTGTNTANEDYGPLYIYNDFRGIVTVVDDAVIKSTNWAIYNYSKSDSPAGGVLNLIDCTVEKTSGNTYKKHLIWFRGPITVNIGGGTLEQTAEVTSSIGQLIYTSQNTGANINLKDGGKLIEKGADWAVYLSKGTFFNMAGGNFIGGTGCALVFTENSHVVISGGTITSRTKDELIGKRNGTLLVTGGEFSNTGVGVIFKTYNDTTGYFVLNKYDDFLLKYTTAEGPVLKHASTNPICVISHDIVKEDTVIDVDSTGGDITLSECNLTSDADTIVSASSADINLYNSTVICSKEGQAIKGGAISGDGTQKIYNAGEGPESDDGYAPTDIAMLLKGGDKHQYSFNVKLKPATTYRFIYTYRTTGNIPEFEVLGDVELLSIRDRSTTADNSVQTYHITTDNFNKTDEEYTFKFSFSEDTYGEGFYIADMQLYKLRGGLVDGNNLLSQLNPANKKEIKDVLIEEGQNLDVELNNQVANNGWFGSFSANSTNVKDYVKYVKVTDNFFNVKTKEEKAEKEKELRKVLLGSLELNLVLDYDEHCDGVVNIQDLLRLKIANNSTQTPPTFVGEEMSTVKPNELPKMNFATVSNFIKEEKYISLAEGATADNYNAYINTLKNNGFIVYAENSIDNNSFATLINEYTTSTVYFIRNESKIRVVSEPKTVLYPRQKDNAYTSVGKQNLLTSIKGDTTLEGSSMSYVIRLDDGSFIIIDGGTGTGSDPDTLYNYLKAQSTDMEKPIISAWIFTHCHEDHIGNFSVFSEQYHDSVIVERIYYNFQTEEDILQGNGAVMVTDPSENYVPYRYNNFKKVIKTYYSDVPKVTPHTGDKYYIKNAVIDILYTHEDELPSIIKTMNNSSTVFRIDINGQSMLITGDIESSTILDKIVARYPNCVKCDFVQAPHHGITNHLSFYQAVNPTYFLLPINHTGYNTVLDNENGKNPANYWLAHESTKMRHVITPGGRTVSIPLPFNPSDSEAIRAPKWDTQFKDYSNLY